MHYKKYRLVSIFMLAIMVLNMLLFAACNKPETASSEVNDADSRISHHYSSRSVDLFKKDWETYAYNAIEYQGKYYVVTVRYPIDLESNDMFNVVLTKISASGEIESEIELNRNINYYVGSDIVDGRFFYVTMDGKLEAIDLDTGELIFSEQHDSTLCGVCAGEDCYVVLAVGHIYKYNYDNQLIATIDNDEWSYYNSYRSYYEADGKSYLIADSDFGWKYYELDFDEKSSNLVYDPCIDNTTVVSCSGNCVFDSKGEYCLDLENSLSRPLALWSETDLQPPVYTDADPVYIAVDDNAFLQIYNYQNGIAQLVIYSYEITSDYSDRTILTVGGYNCNYDIMLQNAIYRFNTSQDEYRVVIEDYNDQFSFNSYSGAAAATAALIQYFNDGNAPDIFYGEAFDYNSFADSNMTLDIAEYISPDLQEKIDSFTPNIRDLMFDNNGKCYRLFSSYQLQSYFSAYTEDNDITLSELTELSEELGIVPYYNAFAMNITENIIKFAVQNGKSFDVDDYREILEFAFTYGYDINDYTGSVSGMTDASSSLLFDLSLYSVFELEDVVKHEEKPLIWVGNPSLDSSFHVINTFGEVAISSSTEYPEACCDFIACLFDDDVQDLANFSSMIPVVDPIMHKMLDYAQDHSLVADEDISYYNYISFEDECSPETVSLFLESVSSADSVRYYDWGLSAIIDEEVTSYYRDGKPVDEIASSLKSRIDLYLAEAN